MIERRGKEGRTERRKEGRRRGGGKQGGIRGGCEEEMKTNKIVGERDQILICFHLEQYTN